MKFVIVVLDVKVNASVAMDYFSCVLAKNNDVIGIVREKEVVEKTIQEISRNRKIKSRIDKKKLFAGKEVNLIEIDFE